MQCVKTKINLNLHKNNKLFLIRFKPEGYPNRMPEYFPVQQYEMKLLTNLVLKI